MEAVDAELSRVTLAAQRAEAEAENERELRLEAQGRLRAAESRAALMAQQLRDAEAERHRLQLHQSQAALRAREEAAEWAGSARAGLLPMVRVTLRTPARSLVLSIGGIMQADIPLTPGVMIIRGVVSQGDTPETATASLASWVTSSISHGATSGSGSNSDAAGGASVATTGAATSFAARFPGAADGGVDHTASTGLSRAPRPVTLGDLEREIAGGAGAFLRPQFEEPAPMRQYPWAQSLPELIGPAGAAAAALPAGQQQPQQAADGDASQHANRALLSPLAEGALHAAEVPMPNAMPQDVVLERLRNRNRRRPAPTVDSPGRTF